MITENILEQLGFKYIENKSYVNGKQWLLQISEEYLDEGQIISENGTWFEGIGTHRFEETGEMAVSVLCRGNYVCRSAWTVERLREIYSALSEKELPEID